MGRYVAGLAEKGVDGECLAALEAVEDLTELDMLTVHGRKLFSRVEAWKKGGVPRSLFDGKAR